MNELETLDKTNKFLPALFIYSILNDFFYPFRSYFEKKHMKNDRISFFFWIAAVVLVLAYLKDQEQDHR